MQTSLAGNTNYAGPVNIVRQIIRLPQIFAGALASGRRQDVCVCRGGGGAADFLALFLNSCVKNMCDPVHPGPQVIF